MRRARSARGHAGPKGLGKAERRENTGMDVRIHEDFENRSNAASPSAAEFHLSLGALVKTSQHKLTMSQRFRSGETAVGRAQHHLKQFVTDLVEHHVTLQQTG